MGSRSITAKPVYAVSGTPLVALKWRLHDKDRVFPAMTLQLTVQSANELRAALTEALDQIDTTAAPSAKMDKADGRSRS